MKKSPARRPSNSTPRESLETSTCSLLSYLSFYGGLIVFHVGQVSCAYHSSHILSAIHTDHCSHSASLLAHQSHSQTLPSPISNFVPFLTSHSFSQLERLLSSPLGEPAPWHTLRRLSARHL